MPDRGRPHPTARSEGRGTSAMTIGVPRVALLAGGAISDRVDAEAALGALARGLVSAGAAPPELWPLEPALTRTPAATRALLDELAYDERMRAARAVILCERSLAPETLDESTTFELATRARQAGVPAFAVTGENRLGSFEARILDLQAIEQARSVAALAAAGARLAAML